MSPQGLILKNVSITWSRLVRMFHMMSCPHKLRQFETFQLSSLKFSFFACKPSRLFYPPPPPDIVQRSFQCKARLSVHVKTFSLSVLTISFANQCLKHFAMHLVWLKEPKIEMTIFKRENNSYYVGQKTCPEILNIFHQQLSFFLFHA